MLIGACNLMVSLVHIVRRRLYPVDDPSVDAIESLTGAGLVFLAWAWI